MSEIDYEHELSNGWDKLGVMVLTELRRIGDNQDALDEKVQSLITWRTVQETRADDKRRRRERFYVLAGIAATLVAGAIGAVATIAATAFLS